MTASPLRLARGARAIAWRTRSTNSARLAQVGDRVVERLVGELLLERLALADVAAVEDDAADVLVVEQVGVQDLELARLPSRWRSVHSSTCVSLAA